MATVLETFDKWKDFLADRVEQAKKAGLGEETISKLAFQIGEFLENKVEPENGEELVLKDLWDVSSEEEKKVLAKLMVKLVENK